jgi:outer membrane protein TolC
METIKTKSVFTNSKLFFSILLLIIFNLNEIEVFSQSNLDSLLSLKVIIEKSIQESEKVKIQQFQTEKSTLDQSKVWQSYLPKITAEATYTHLNDDIRLPSDLEYLLFNTQKLLIKEATAMQMSAMAIPDAYKAGFSTLYTADQTKPATLALSKAITENMADIPPIQAKNIMKANIQAQMLLFSGLKVPYLLKASSHQIQANKDLTDKEKSSVILEVISTYDKLAVVHQSEQALNHTETYLNEQMKFVEKAIKNGLATDLERQKINLAKQQLLTKRIELNTNRKLLHLKLQSLSGIPSEQFSRMLPELKPFEAKPMDKNIEQRGDLKALDEAIQATNYKRKAENTEYIPKVFAFAKKELLTNDLSTFDPEWYVGVGIKWTIFDGLTAKTNAQQIKIDRQILEERKNEAVELLTLNLQRATLELEKNNQLIEVAKQQVNTATETFNLTKKQYEVGLVASTDYLISVNSLENAQLELIKTIYQQRVSFLDVLDAQGKLSLENLSF